MKSGPVSQYMIDLGYCKLFAVVRKCQLLLRLAPVSCSFGSCLRCVFDVFDWCNTRLQTRSKNALPQWQSTPRHIAQYTKSHENNKHMHCCTSDRKGKASWTELVHQPEILSASPNQSHPSHHSKHAPLATSIVHIQIPSIPPIQ